MSKNNIRILETIIHSKRISQNEIAKLSGINKAIVSKQVKELQKDKVVTIKNVKNRKMIEFNHKLKNVISIDIGRTSVRGYITTMLGHRLDSKIIEVQINEVENLSIICFDLIESLLSISKKQVIGIGFGVHGIVNRDNIIEFIPNTKWKNLNLANETIKKYGIPVFINNIANISAKTEQILFHNNSHSVLNVNVSSGVGAGLIYKGNQFNGHSGASLELGHIIVDNNKKHCSCGQIGCIETIISHPALFSYCNENNLVVSNIDELIKHIKNKDPIATKMYENYIRTFSMGLRNLLLIINPEQITINCVIIKSIDGSIELIKDLIDSPMVKYKTIESSILEQNSKMISISTYFLGQFYNLENIDLSNYSQEILKTYL